MSAEMDRLEASVTALKTASDSATALIQGLAPMIRDAAGDRVKSLALADTLDAEAKDLGDAVAANTPTP